MNSENPHCGERLTPAQATRLEQWLPSRQARLRRLWSGKGGRKLAVNFMCLECCGEDVLAVRGCQAVTCPLWHFRPYQQKTPL